MSAKHRTKTTAVKITPEQRMVLSYLSEKYQKTVSTLIYEAVVEKYDFAALLPEALSFFESSARLINQSDEIDN